MRTSSLCSFTRQRAQARLPEPLTGAIASRREQFAYLPSSACGRSRSNRLQPCGRTPNGLQRPTEPMHRRELTRYLNRHHRKEVAGR